MSVVLETVGPRAGAAPLTYTLAELGTVDVQSVFAHFDGTSASGSWRPTVTVRAQNGAILARVFPSDTLAAGDTADVTYAPFLGRAQTTIGPIDSTANVGDTWGVHSEGAPAPVTDDFQRANENPLTQGGNWKTRSNLPFKIVSDLAVPVSGGGIAIYEGGGAFADGSSITEFGSSPTVLNAEFIAAMRVAAAAESAPYSGYTALQVYNGVTHQVQIRKATAGVESVLAFVNPWPTIGAPALGDAIALYCNGTALEAWSRISGVWARVTSTTDSTYATGYAGMLSDNASVQAFTEADSQTPTETQGGPVTSGFALLADGFGGSYWGAN